MVVSGRLIRIRYFSHRWRSLCLWTCSRA